MSTQIQNLKTFGKPLPARSATSFHHLAARDYGQRDIATAADDPFAEADDDTGESKQTQNYIHIRIQQRNGRKTLTTVQGLPKKFDQKKILKVIKKKFACNGTIVTDSEMGEVIQLQGDQRKDVQEFLVAKDGLELDSKTIKAGTSAYLAHLFASSLMSRWLLHYSPFAVTLRLLSMSILLSYIGIQCFRLLGAFQPNLAALSRSFPIWIIISIVLLLLYFCTQQDISIEKDRDDRRRRLVLRSKCLYAMAGSSLFIYMACMPPYDGPPADATDLNADIVGKGVQFSTFAPAAGMIVTSLLGYFHVASSGAKELGVAQLFNMGCLAINLCSRFRDLKIPELLAVLISIDLSSSVLSIMLVDKEVLAARKLVYSTCVAQLVAVGVIGYVVSHSDALKEPDPWRFRVLWWGGFTGPFFYHDDFAPEKFSRLGNVAWLFYAIKLLGVIRSIVRSLTLTHTFDDSERKTKVEAADQTLQTDESAPIELAELSGAESSHAVSPEAIRFQPIRWLGIPVPYIQISYTKCIATTSTAQLEHIPQIIASMIAIVSLLKECGYEGGQWVEWGQLAPVGVACLGLMHWLGYTTLLNLMWKGRHHFGLPTIQRFDEAMMLLVMNGDLPRDHRE
ncbi:Eukaryotic translation initiation factor eIF-1 [Cyphellophora attinorum]|uniref:Eukaryotic translation initiation factor eIF-1 n=1 Tax=Cyphellophora attinorum TaxID=1664694 RepID=A0A0N0NPZ1_9EURO|nr:Eukaryotic translation initiation factor eIF-1 [Phialophora attinorum]KPI43321.1 Eukaryotic translation initiation factor eIF-1 [Phialophora attinorum]